MQTYRAVLLKSDHPKYFCEVEYPEEGNAAPFKFVLWANELYVRQELHDHHDGGENICAYVYQLHYEI